MHEFEVTIIADSYDKNVHSGVIRAAKMILIGRDKQHILTNMKHIYSVIGVDPESVKSVEIVEVEHKEDNNAE